MQKIEAGRNAFGLLQRQAIEIAPAHELLDLAGALRVDADRFERVAPELERGLVGLAQLELDALGEQLQAVPAIVGAHVELGTGKFGLNEVDDAAGSVAIVDADRDQA